MYGRVPDEQIELRESIIQESINSAPNLDGKVAGCSEVLAAFRSTLEIMFGGIGTQAVVNRAIYLTRQEYPWLGRVLTKEGSLDCESLGAGLRRGAREGSEEVLRAFVGNLFAVIHGLVGRMALPILREIEADLAARKANRATDEEK